MIYLKENVRFNVLIPQIYSLFPIIDDVWKRLSGTPLVEPVITAAADGKHMVGSFHAKNKALDLRSWNLEPKNKNLILAELKRLLDKDYDILLEGLGTENEHFHIEYDPKG